MSGDLHVSGGSGGIHADVDDMRSTANTLDQLSHSVDRVAAAARGAAISGALVRTAIFSPGSAAHCEGSLIEAAATASLLQVGIFAEVLVLRARADLFVLADAAGDVADHVIKAIAVPFVIAGGIVVGIETYLGSVTVEVGRVFVGVLTGDIPLSQVGDRLKAIPGAAAQDTLAVLKHLLSTFPEITDIVTGGLPTFLSAETRGALPSDLEGTIGLLQRIAGTAGLLQDRSINVVPGAAHGSGPGGVSQLIADIGGLSKSSAGAHDSSTIRVVKISEAGRPPRWVVEIPGTQEWNPSAGGDPNDLTSNLELMQRHGALMEAVRDAMRQAGVGPGDDVLLSGHSQGGICAAALAADPATRQQFHITHVITAGSPIAHMPIPDDIHVLSIEHTQDVVPRLDGQDNPDRPNWTTVTRDVGDKPGVADNPFEAHSTDLYADTAAEITQDPSLSADTQSFSEFFDGEATSQDYLLSRT